MATSQTLYNSDVGDTLSGTAHYFLYQLKTMPLTIILYDVIYCYTVIYYLVPRYLFKKRYGYFTVGLVTITLVCLAPALISVLYISNQDGFLKEGSHARFLSIINIIKLFFIYGSPAVCIIFLAIKMFKTWYLKQQEKQMLLKTNADAEIQMLKAQIHPHFLFNTLNNIYALTLNKSSRAGELVLQLEEMLQYMINDCDTELVPLDREIKMLQDYMGLEKVRYGNHLNLQVEIKGDYNGKSIAPLLMIPFVENAFKHGASRIIENPWVKLTITIERNRLYLDLSNNKSAQPNHAKNKNGIGLTNVEKRLKLLYPHEYTLTIKPAENSFSVQMQVPLYHSTPDTEPAVRPMANTLN